MVVAICRSYSPPFDEELNVKKTTCKILVFKFCLSYVTVYGKKKKIHVIKI